MCQLVVNQRLLGFFRVFFNTPYSSGNLLIFNLLGFLWRLLEQNLELFKLSQRLNWFQPYLLVSLIEKNLDVAISKIY